MLTRWLEDQPLRASGSILHDMPVSARVIWPTVGLAGARYALALIDVLRDFSYRFESGKVRLGRFAPRLDVPADELDEGFDGERDSD